MAATNIFYCIPSHKGTKLISFPGGYCTLNQFCNHIIQNEPIGRHDFIVATGTKLFRPNNCGIQDVLLQNNSRIDILIPVLGGKGGFGSLLRAIGAQIEKTTNRDACRDLSGRRLRDIKREEELKKLIALRDKLEEEKKRRKKEKLEKLKKTTETSNQSKSIQELVQMFDDNDYNKRRLKISEIIDAAVEKGIINFNKRQSNSDDSGRVKRTKTSAARECHKSSPIEESNVDNNGGISDSDSEKGNEISDLWLGLEPEEVNVP